MNSTTPANNSTAGGQASRSKAKTHGEDSGSDDEMTEEQKA